jgi:tRNA-splicing ligase RtcB
MISGEDLKHIGYPEGRVIGVALEIAHKQFTGMDRDEVLGILNKLVRYPENFLDDEILSPIAWLLKPPPPITDPTVYTIKQKGDPYAIFGAEHIEEGAIQQMDTAMKLEVTVGGALMPDAHQGYGLPIGGVLATNNAIIPYGVGVDIGCRMALTIYDIPHNHLLDNMHKYQRELIAYTKFAAGSSWEGRQRADHEVLHRKEFNATPFIKGLKEKAATQLGTSGGGNHFVEFGILDFETDDVKLNIPKGKYMALLTHSGSRGFGATVAGHYTKLAKELCKLPGDAANLAYFDLNSEAGQEYWISMNLAGDYASACHEVIHNRLTKAIGGNVLGKVENHHNFAWKEKWEGRDVIVHRKGATPASTDVMGIIPGSMTAPGFLVRGKGDSPSINSASHGAGRQMSRSKAIKTITRQEMKKVLKDHGVTLIGAGLDEAPMAYKDIHKVMASQRELVDVVAMFTPKLVRMAADGSRED